MTTTRRITLLVAVLVSCFCSCCGAIKVVDDFTTYSPPTTGAPSWQPRDISYLINTKGAYSFSGSTATFSEMMKTKMAVDINVVADLTVLKRSGSGTGWGVAGIAVFVDSANFWALHLVESPSSSSYSHAIELAQERGNKWQVADGKITESKVQSGWKWKFNERYRMALGVTPNVSKCSAKIVGTISNPKNGTVYARIAWCVNASGVLGGRAALHTGIMATTYHQVTANWTTEYSLPSWLQQSIPASFVPPTRCNAVGTQEATGYFRTQKVGDKWWLIDPNGDPFYYSGVDHVNYNLFYTEALQRAEYHDNVAAKYGSETAWAKATIQRLLNWGFNTLATDHSPSLRHMGMAHMLTHTTNSFSSLISYITPKTTWTGFPDVFHPLWDDYLTALFNDVKETSTDPAVIGHFVDNEIQWWGVVEQPRCTLGSSCLFLEVWRRPANNTAKQRWVKFLKEQIPTNFKSTWHAIWNMSGVTSADSLLSHTDPTDPPTANATELARLFVRLVAETYFSTVSKALKAADPNHLYLCNRFPGRAPDILDIAEKYCDVISWNNYPSLDPHFGIYDATVKTLNTWYSLAPTKPIIITEWSFPSLDSGLPCTNGAGMRVETQKRRASCMKWCQAFWTGLPYIVGNSYFMWVDEPKEGVSTSFTENTNYGLVNVTDDAWSDVVAAHTKSNSEACARHAAPTQTWIKWKSIAVTDATGPAPRSFINTTVRGMNVKVPESSTVFASLRWKGMSLGAITAQFGFLVPGVTATKWSTIATLNMTSFARSGGFMTCGFDVHFTSATTPGITGHFTLSFADGTLTSDKQPWVMMWCDSITNNHQVYPNITIRAVQLNFVSLLGPDGATKDVSVSCPYTNYWQRGATRFDYTYKVGVGSWSVGNNTLSSSNNVLTFLDYRATGVMLARGQTWTAEGSSVVLFFPYEGVTNSTLTYKMLDAVKIRVQDEVAVAQDPDEPPVLSYLDSAHESSFMLGFFLVVVLSLLITNY